MQTQKDIYTEEKEKTSETPPKSKLYAGYLFLVLSFAMYSLALLLPVFNLAAGTKTILFVIFVVIAEVSFVVSALMLGKEIVKRYRRYFNPLNWFRKKKTDPPDTRIP